MPSCLIFTILNKRTWTKKFQVWYTTYVSRFWKHFILSLLLIDNYYRQTENEFSLKKYLCDSVSLRSILTCWTFSPRPFHVKNTIVHQATPIFSNISKCPTCVNYTTKPSYSRNKPLQTWPKLQIIRFIERLLKRLHPIKVGFIYCKYTFICAKIKISYRVYILCIICNVSWALNEVNCTK